MIKREVGQAGFVSGEIDAHIRIEATNFLVGTVDVGEKPRLKVIGTVVDADLDRVVTLGGVIENDERQGGLQFKIAGVIDLALEEASLRTYLGSGLVKHVGPATAAVILNTFGADTLRILLEEPERLDDIRGITPSALPEVKTSLATTLHLAGIVGLLTPFGISLGICKQVYKRHGSGAVAAIRANPWGLATDFNGVGFKTADGIALRLGASPDAPERAEAALVHVVALAARSGHTVVPRTTATKEAGELLARPVTELEEALERLEARRVLATVAEPDGVATPELARAEQRLARALGGLLKHATRWEAAMDEANIAALEASSGITFDDTQRAAVSGVLSRGVTVLTGGPGTGKTTIVRAVCDLAERHGLSVALMSFTGKAAKRLSEATGRPASTIHRYLRFTPGSDPKGPEHDDDVVIVDEVSMLDVALADQLTGFLSPHTRLVMVGDVDQLPSIGAGNVLDDLVKSGEVPVYRLSTIHRTGEGSGIPNLAAAINAGSKDLPYDGTTTHFIRRDDPSSIAQWVRAFFLARRDRADDYQVLAPVKAGTAGVNSLNGIIAEVLRGPAASRGRSIVRESYDMCAGDRIIWTMNDKELGLFNGEIGTLLEVRSNGSALVEFVDKSYLVVSEKVAANCFSLAYALTVHKAQGSEFATAIVVQDQGAYHMLARRLLYTAVSRARQNAVIVGQPVAVAMAVARHDTGHRRTALAPLLRAALAPADTGAPKVPLYDPDSPF